MTDDEKNTIRWVILTLGSPRNRHGRLDPSANVREELRRKAIEFKLPNGGQDSADQARMVLQALIGDKITELAT